MSLKGSMGEFKETTVESWRDFVDLSSQHPYGHPTTANFFYRGQANASWGLVPSFVRYAERLSVQAARHLEQAAWQEFLKQAAFLIPHGAIPHYGDLINWLVMMQHHGVPTRLLDWTRSPYVAAYFAVEQADSQPGVVWIMDAAVLVHLERVPEFAKYNTGDWTDFDYVRGLFIDPDAGQTILAATPTRYTDRMFAQQTVSFVSPHILTKHHQVIAKWIPRPLRDSVCEKVIIPPELKPDFMAQLRKMNLTASSLFPGIDGFGRSIREFILLECRGTRGGKA